MCVSKCRIILHIMNCVKKLFVVPCVFIVCNAHAFPDGVSFGVGISALGGMNVMAGYRYKNDSSWWGRFGMRIDFADTDPLKSAIDSAIDRIMRDGVDVGDGVNIDDGRLNASHYALLLDYYPFDNAWRVTTGMMWGDMTLASAIKGEIAEIPSERFYFYINGDHYYYNGNKFNGAANIDWDFYGPYFGTGFDVGMFCGFRFVMDVGVVLTNRPSRLSLEIPHEQLYVYNTESGVWGPVTVPKLDADVAIAERDANHKLSDLRVYPVIKLGVVYRF